VVATADSPAAWTAGSYERLTSLQAPRLCRCRVRCTARRQALSFLTAHTSKGRNGQQQQQNSQSPVGSRSSTSPAGCSRDSPEP
jgi:hypothetical protein